MIIQTRKILRFLHSNIQSFFIPTPVFIRIIPTDRCNLRCKYCFQMNPNSPIMGKKDFNKYLKKAHELGTSIISFLGGEPMTWPHIYHAIKECNKKNMITQMTTNTTLLSKKTLNKLGKAGLDILEVSADSILDQGQSKKNLLVKNKLSPMLLDVRKKYGVYIKVHAVITRTNINQIEKLIDFAHKLNFPISLGYIIPPLLPSQKWGGDYLIFTKKDYSKLKQFIQMIKRKKQEGYNIIDSNSYFEGIFDYIEKKSRWDCKHSKKYSGIIIAPDGRLRSCTKLMDYLNYSFLDLTPSLIKEVREKIKKKIDSCNPKCYSNCAYAAYYYSQHKIEFMKNNFFPSIKNIY